MVAIEQLHGGQSQADGDLYLSAVCRRALRGVRAAFDSDLRQWSDQLDGPAPRHHSCFALGTKVCTITGPVAIEKVEIGDEVLAQNPFSGELTYKPVLQTTVGHTDLLSIDLGAEKIEATPGHVFWVSGKGWRMAANLKTGDELHSVEGWAEVIDVEPIAAADTRNLVVADYGTYFVGDNRLLVHDVTMLQPYAGKVPGDKPSEELASQ